MKKLMFSAALMAATAFSLSAQEKGDFTVGGMIGVQGGSNSVSVTYQNQTQSESTPASTSLSFSPQFSWFVIDNLELSAGLEYSMQKDYAGTNTNDKNYFDFLHLAMFTVGANYYVPIVKDKFFYTPGVQFGFGGGSYNSDNGAGIKTKLKIPFAFGFSADLGKFEFKPLDFLGISFNILDFNVVYTSINTGVNEVKTHSTSFTAGFNYGMSAGVKYYF